MHSYLKINSLKYLIFGAVVLFTSKPLGAQTELPRRLFATVDQQAMKHWVDSVYRTLSTEEQLSQLIMPIVYPSQEKASIRREEGRIDRYKWGGILYQRGLMYEQLLMNNRLQKRSRVPMLIALDGEWGLYMRLKDAPRFPRNLGLGLDGSDVLIKEYAQEVARQCRLMGIHINFAPTVDVNINPLNPVIGSRSFGSNPKEVSRLSSAYAQGLEAGGVLSVAKHFPGHGDTSEDSHKTLPIVLANRKRLDSVELAPFRHYINQGFGGIMTAHLRVPALEQRPIPSSLSYEISTQLLQNQLGFRGLIFTDGLEMKGVQQAALGDIGTAALLAGNDILLGPANPEEQLRQLTLSYLQGRLPQKLIEHKVRKVLAYKYRLIICEKPSLEQPEYIKEQIWKPTTMKLQEKLWLHALYPIHHLPQGTQTIKEMGVRSIAIVDYGKRSFEPRPLPQKTSSGVKLYLVSPQEISKTYKLYDLILINNYTTQKLPNELIAIALNKPTILSYYTPPFKVKYAGWMKPFIRVWLAMEATQEARDAVLFSITGESFLPTQRSLAPQLINSGEHDPTALMTPQR